MHSYIGNIHIHSSHSDGAQSIPEIAKEASQAGLDFIIVTDHDIIPLSDEGFYDDVLVLCGTEVNDTKHHYLALNVHEVIPPNDENPQQVIDAVNAQNGLGFIAHPYEKGSPLVLNNRTYPWTDWSVTGFTGIEVWNWSSQWRDGVQNILLGLFYAYLHPTGPITGPTPEAMARFDEITRSRKITAIAGSDAHNWPIRRGPIRRDIFPYHYLFRTANNCVLLSEPLSKDLPTAKAQIYAALRHGRSYIVNRLASEATGFAFFATCDHTQYQMGDTVPLTDNTALHVQCPLECRGCTTIRIIHNGTLLDEIDRCNVAIRAYKPGTYRLEIRHGNKPWIFTNPIYVSS
ncbi:CehA/McbA family metallohydrolase [Dethiobacter alkaliphilus]|uniref:CehA/McbA family metallohydrolase n=1 Tax=Dethiobacter alkaliphilus TaxID=427926 RepID=UPI00222736D2|nr:CehA/McbA family metallohydrolase [Dethiobacter alkaliphilus]MCW3488837.1 CehA/McbA family metallohydrolase [Dethiobacter alkaliphilus]